MYQLDIEHIKAQISLREQVYGFGDGLGKEADKLTYFATLCINSVIRIMNDKSQKPEQVFDVMVSEYQNEEPFFYELADIILGLVHDIKTQFYLAGFDPRLKYKLLVRQFGRRTIQSIIMDLEETFLAFKPTEYVEDIGQVVSDNPDIEVLNDLFAGRIHPGR